MYAIRENALWPDFAGDFCNPKYYIQSVGLTLY